MNAIVPHQFIQRVAVVAGGARGIGLEIVRQILEQGHRVALLDISDENLAGAQASIGEDGANLLLMKCDITIGSAVEAAVGRVAQELGTVEILVNCAGWSPNKPFIEMPEDEYSRIIAINYVGVLNLCRSTLPQMQQRGWGRIVNIGSDAARVGTPREAVYAGAKAAVIGFSKSLSAEVARAGVTVNVVCPGTTDTPLLRAVLSDDQIERRMKANPSGRIGRPEDIAGAVMYFVSENAGYINGQVLSVNGGITRVG